MKKATDFKNQWLSIWWAHQDLNLGPKDYEQLQEIKPITKHRVTSDLQRCGSKCGSIQRPKPAPLPDGQPVAVSSGGSDCSNQE